MPHHRDELLRGLPPRQTLAPEPSWQDAGIRGGGGVGYISEQSGSFPVVTTSNTSMATYTNAASVLNQ